MLVSLPSLLKIPVTLDHYDPWPAGQWLQLTPQHHSLLLFCGQGQVNCQVQIDAQPSRPETYGEASLCLIPAGVTYGMMSDRPFSLNRFNLPVNLMETMATAVSLGDNPQLRLNLGIQDAVLYHLAMTLKLVIVSESDRQPNLLMGGRYSDPLTLALAAYLVQHYGGGKSPETPIPQLLSTQYLEWQPPLEIHHRYSPISGVAPGREQLSTVLRPANPASLTVAMAIAWLNQLYIDKTGCPLSDIETRILRGVLQRENYREVAAATHRSVGHIKTVAAGLWKQLSEITGQPIRKSNLRSYLEYQGLGLAMPLPQHAQTF